MRIKIPTEIDLLFKDENGRLYRPATKISKRVIEISEKGKLTFNVLSYKGKRLTLYHNHNIIIDHDDMVYYDIEEIDNFAYAINKGVFVYA